MEVIQLSLFGKMFPERSVQTVEKTSAPCWKNLPAWKNQTLQFLDLRGGADGARPEQSPGTDGAWLGDSSTLNIGECPREENVSLLSWILQVDVPEKYYLSAKACRGILTRASRRGKKLQELLETALLEMIEWWASRGQAYTLKIRSGCAGGGKGALVQTEKTGTLSTLQDQTLFQPVYCLAGNIIDRSETAGANGSGVKENQSYTLNTVDRPAVAYKVFDARGNGDGKIVPTITGDHESRVTDYTAILAERYINAPIQTTTGTLSPGAHAGSYNGQDAYNDMLVRGQDKRLLKWIVRRLTPTECERLQGYPDGWTDIGEWTDTKGKKHKAADSPRYKALGNSIALPQWFWIAQKMKQYLPAGATLGSLFDGIGGFPLVWETTYGKGTARWASEIEEFPIAVTKRRFGSENVNSQ